MLFSKKLTNLLVTGGAGFMGSAFIRYLLNDKSVSKIVNLDLLTYAGNLENLTSIKGDPRYTFIQGDICDDALVKKVIVEHEIDTIVHFAAETHVDRSIEGPYPFIKTNIEGTHTLLEEVRKNPSIYFHHISTDEVYGSIKKGAFTEDSPYLPNSPYAASKASSDHLVRSYIKTYGIKATISHSSNNYGPCQYFEKFIPMVIKCCIEKKSFPIYGNGENIRNWLYVDDHAKAVAKILKKGKLGQVYNIGSQVEKSNIDLLHLIIELYCELTGDMPSEYTKLITFVEDRKGHDFRYGINSSKIRSELAWKDQMDLKQGLIQTIKWYLAALSTPLS